MQPLAMQPLACIMVIGRALKIATSTNIMLSTFRLTQSPPTIAGTVYEDWREFYAALHAFGHHTDFTYRDDDSLNHDKFMGHFLSSHYIDYNLPLDEMWNEYKDSSNKVKDEIIETFQKFQIGDQLACGFFKHLK